MTLRGYLITMSAATLVCWSGFGYVVTMIDPETTNWLGFILFYLSLFLALIGSAALAGFLVRFIGLKRQLVFHSVKDAFRQSFLFAFMIIAALFLLSNNLFSWLNLIFLVLGLSILELFLISYKRN